jgi:acyl-CoA synthetase (AMP-forming)/AMP-acid ligase II
MVPLAVIVRASLPHNQNGKIDRRALADEYRTIFQDENP